MTGSCSTADKWQTLWAHPSRARRFPGPSSRPRYTPRTCTRRCASPRLSAASAFRSGPSCRPRSWLARFSCCTRHRHWSAGCHRIPTWFLGSRPRRPGTRGSSLGLLWVWFLGDWWWWWESPLQIDGQSHMIITLYVCYMLCTTTDGYNGGTGTWSHGCPCGAAVLCGTAVLSSCLHILFITSPCVWNSYGHVLYSPSQIVMSIATWTNSYYGHHWESRTVLQY